MFPQHLVNIEGLGSLCLSVLHYGCGVAWDGTWSHCTAAGVRCRKKTLDIHFSTTRPNTSCRMERANGRVKFFWDPRAIGKDEFVEHEFCMASTYASRLYLGGGLNMIEFIFSKIFQE